MRVAEAVFVGECSSVQLLNRQKWSVCVPSLGKWSVCVPSLEKTSRPTGAALHEEENVTTLKLMYLLHVTYVLAARCVVTRKKAVQYVLNQRFAPIYFIPGLSWSW